MLFMIVVYLVPGLASAVALLVYVALVVLLLTGVNGLNPQLRPHHFGVQLLQLQFQAADADGGSQALSPLVGLHGRDLGIAVRDNHSWRRENPCAMP